MPKLHASYTEPLNLLVTRDMKNTLTAVRYHKGIKSVGEATKDVILMGLDKFLAGLSPVDRKRFDEILDNVKVQAAYLRDTRLDK